MEDDKRLLPVSTHSMVVHDSFVDKNYRRLTEELK